MYEQSFSVFYNQSQQVKKEMGRRLTGLLLQREMIPSGLVHPYF
jgi:hypothetical protein